MDDLMAKLQSVLNDEQSMKQLSELAGALSSEQSTEQAQTQNSAPTDFSQLLQGLGLGQQPAQQTAPAPAAPMLSAGAGGIDMAKLMQLQALLSQTNKQDKNVDLLLALRPLLKEENQAKIDRLIKIFKLFAIYPVIKESGLLGGDLFGLL